MHLECSRTHSLSLKCNLNHIQADIGQFAFDQIIIKFMRERVQNQYNGLSADRPGYHRQSSRKHRPILLCIMDHQVWSNPHNEPNECGLVCLTELSVSIQFQRETVDFTIYNVSQFVDDVRMDGWMDGYLKMHSKLSFTIYGERIGISFPSTVYILLVCTGNTPHKLQ